ncbi:hypothetical protein TWF788_004701 [Orbilia oligospora]|uniref:Uncharacterized protein n=2 Tax=Orbilia oligospora TaxID=2813651 RepID=A0A7C8P3D8_ORBOL|nr:hypothetical protein TWF788_004701 [Orbilia oligospora]
MRVSASGVDFSPETKTIIRRIKGRRPRFSTHSRSMLAWDVINSTRESRSTLGVEYQAGLRIKPKNWILDDRDCRRIYRRRKDFSIISQAVELKRRLQVQNAKPGAYNRLKLISEPHQQY